MSCLYVSKMTEIVLGLPFWKLSGKESGQGAPISLLAPGARHPRYAPGAVTFSIAGTSIFWNRWKDWIISYFLGNDFALQWKLHAVSLFHECCVWLLSFIGINCNFFRQKWNLPDTLVFSRPCGSQKSHFLEPAQQVCAYFQKLNIPENPNYLSIRFLKNISKHEHKWETCSNKLRRS